MEAIGITISNVIDKIEAAAQETESQRSQSRASRGPRFEQLTAKDKTGEDNAIL